MEIIITCIVNDNVKLTPCQKSDLGDLLDEFFEGNCSEYGIEVRDLSRSQHRLTARAGVVIMHRIFGVSLCNIPY